MGHYSFSSPLSSRSTTGEKTATRKLNPICAPCRDLRSVALSDPHSPPKHTGFASRSPEGPPLQSAIKQGRMLHCEHPRVKSWPCQVLDSRKIPNAGLLAPTAASGSPVGSTCYDGTPKPGQPKATTEGFPWLTFPRACLSPGLLFPGLLFPRLLFPRPATRAGNPLSQRQSALFP